MPTRPAAVPDEFFHAIAALIPRLLSLAQECDIRPMELLVLWHIRQFGKINEDNFNVIPQREVRHMLGQTFMVRSADVSKLLSRLQAAELVDQRDFTERKRLELFGSRSDGSAVVILTPTGLHKLEEFKKTIISHFGIWASTSPKSIHFALKRSIPLAVSFARWVVSHY